MRVRVGVVTPRYPPVSAGGGERSAKLLADGLVESDRVTDVTVFSFDGRGNELVDGVRVCRMGAPSSFLTEYQNVRATLSLRGELSRFDVVHAYNMELHPTVGYLSDRLHVPSVATLNSYHFFPKSVTNVAPGRLERIYELVGHPTTGRVLLSCVKRIDRFVALSRAIETIYVERGFPARLIDVIPNMIDPSFHVPERNEPWSETRLLYVGSLTANKGVEHLVTAVASLPASVRLRIVGSGDREATLRDLTRHLDLGNRVEFAGQLPYSDLPGEYAAADVFVHPGVWPEPLNRTVLEAMQAGLPVVCTDVGGPPEVIPDDELLCPPGDAEALAGAIERAISQDPEATGRKNRAYIVENHSPDVIVPRIVDTYESLLAGSRRY